MHKCIEMWASGTLKAVEFEADRFYNVFDGHLKNLIRFLQHPVAGPYLRTYISELGQQVQ
jgi:hypothetical protein